MKLLITGASGYIGSNLIPFLAQRWPGSTMLLFCRNASKLSVISYPDVEVFTSDDFYSIKEFDPKVVIHLAGYLTSSEDTAEIAKLIDSNLIFGTYVLDVLKDCPSLESFVNIGSSTQYAWGEGLKSAYLYSALKTAFRSILDFYSSNLGIQTITTVLYTVYGGENTHRQALDYIMESTNSSSPIKMSPGEQRLDYVHISDVCEYIATIVEKRKQLGHNEVLHCGTGNNISLRELANLVEEYSQLKCNIKWGALPYRKNDIMYACAPQGANLARLGWKARYDIHSGIANYVSQLHIR